MKTLVFVLTICFSTIAMAGFVHESRVNLDGGLVKDTYSLVHDFLAGQTTTITDVQLTGQDLAYVAGWITVESPNGWYFQAGGPGLGGTRWATDFQEYGVTYGTALVNSFTVTTYGYQLISTPIAFSTGPEHSVNNWGAYHFAQLPTPEPATMCLLAAGLGLVRRKQ
jgi:hypothetical protein